MTHEPPPLTTKPELALNRSDSGQQQSQPAHPHTTVADALNDFITFAAEGLTGQTSLAIATAYFDAGGYTQIADSLDKVDHVRLLLGTEPHPPTKRPRSLDPANNTIHQSRQRQLSRALQDNQQSLNWSRNLLEFTPEVCHTIQRLLSWLKSGKVQVRRLEDRFLHAKAFIVEQNQHGVIAGSSNFTRAGLTSNIELNLGNYTPSTVAQVSEFFNVLWEQASEYDLAEIFETPEPHPYLIYLRMLWERYRDELSKEEELPMKLTQFQQHGLMRALRIMEKYGGVLIADEVGLGKTHIAGELISQTIQNRQRALVVAPAVLRDGMWEGFMNRMDFGRSSVKVMSYEQVDAALQDGEMFDGLDLNDVALVVADEAHYLRNPSTKRANAFNQLMSLGGGKKLALMTATPVNNSLNDLFTLFDNILRAGGRGDAALSEIGIASLRGRFDEAVAKDVGELDPRHLFDVIDELSVRRMRQFIKKHYRNDTYEVAGEQMVINFPKAKVAALKYDIDQQLPDFFDRFAVALNVEGDQDYSKNPDVLTLARYAPSRYLKEPEHKSYELALMGLMRSLLLKRFESSPHAFAISCERMIHSNQTFLGLLDSGVVVSKKLLAEIVDSASDDAERVLEEDEDDEQGRLFDPEETTEAGEYDVELLARHIEQDNKILGEFARRARGVSRDDDPTLAALVECLEGIVRRAGSDGGGHGGGTGSDGGEPRDRRKVLIFSYYTDTVDWIHEHLVKKAAEHNSPLACYAGRIARLVGTEHPNRKSQVLQGFAPKTASPQGQGQDKFDIVVSTDVLAEGVNLQQAQNIINYDLPWNPMRLVQRHGRIDRIGSPHKEVFLHCIMPDTRLDELLKLEIRLRHKIGQAEASVGVTEILPEQEKASEVIFSDTREELEKIKQGNAELFEGLGSAAAAMSGEEFRQELREAIADGKGGEIEGMPWRSGTGMAVGASTEVGAGAEPGFVFCVQVGDSRNIQYRFVPLESARRSGPDSAGEKQSEASAPPRVVSDTLDCLLKARPKDGWNTQAVPQNLEVSQNLEQSRQHPVFSAWELAQADIVAEWNKINKQAVEPKVANVLKKAGQLLLDHPPEGKHKEEIDEAIKAVQAPLLKAGEQAIRKIMSESKDDNPRAALEIMEKVKELGLRPYEPPPPNPEIAGEDVHLICWLALV